MPEKEFNFREFFRIAKRRKYIVAGIFAISVSCAWLVLSQKTPLYEAKSTIVMDFRRPLVVRMESVVPTLPLEAGVIRSELDTISSIQMAERVIDHLNLTQDPLARALFPAKPPLLERLDRLKRAVASWLGALVGDHQDPPQEPEMAAGDGDEIPISSLVGALLGGLKVSNDGRSYTVYIEFTSANPQLAARVANAFAEEYLANQVDVKSEGTRSASRWLRERVAELQQQLKVSEEAAQTYRQEAQLEPSAGLIEQQLAQLNAQLVTARAERAQAEARLHAAQQAGGGRSDASSPVLASGLVQSLRQQEITLRRQEADLARHYRSEYPELVQVRAEIVELQRRIAEEISRIVQSFRNDAETAAAREQSFAAAIAELQQQLTERGRTRDQAAVRLRQLEREAEANRSLYELFLNRYKETTEQESLQRPDARLISRAEVPSVPSQPKKLPILLLSAMGGIAFGIILAFVRDRFDPGLHSARELEQLVGLPVLGLMPSLSSRTEPHDYVLRKPHSSFSEALRTTRMAIRSLDPAGRAKVVLVTSSVPREGKTTFCLSLARLLAMDGGKVLLVDTDLRRPKIGRVLGDKATGDIVDLLTGSKTLSEVLQIDESGVHYLAARPGTRNPQALLVSGRMEDVFATAARIYDVIVVDAPPVMLVADAAIVSRVADICLLLVRWGMTPREVVLGALRQLATYKIKVSGLILSRVNLRKHARYTIGETGYFRYSKYFSSASVARKGIIRVLRR